jgi:uncharacterized protein
MTEHDRYIPGVPCWIDTAQPDPDAAVAFYSALFGWEFEDVMPPEAASRYLIARLPGGDVGAVASQPKGATPPAAWNTYIWVQDADETAARVRAAGGSILMAPGEAEDAGRMAIFADTEGAAFSVWQAGRHRGAAVVNEPGSLNFNVLSTRDAAAAEAFYGAVFGWERIPVGDGVAWALPAYGDFLEQRTPGIREGMKDMGAPERFEEVVASLTVVGDAVAPHWDVTFGVADADAIAARAAELGGRVLAAPTDAPWVRTTVIADPQGATFTASKFVPDNKDVAQGAASAA